VHTALINTNRITPPIAPIGIEYLYESLAHCGYNVDILDLCWEQDWQGAMTAFFQRREYAVVGITIRNTDDCVFSTRHSFLPEIFEIISCAKGLSDGLVVLGGVGFSTMPENILRACEADAGFTGGGESAMLELADCMQRNGNWNEIPGIMYRFDEEVVQNPPRHRNVVEIPPMQRNSVDSKRYFREGGQAGIETKRGCSWDCSYCCEPLAKGGKVCTRRPLEVVQELERLLAQGIDHVHTCDSEFNIPIDHARQICEELIQSGLGRLVRWYAYCTPSPFDKELARLMRRAGCVGINFGADSGDDAILKRLGRSYSPEQILDTVTYCRDEGIVVMLDLLFGTPGESRDSIEKTLDLVRESGAERVGVSTGIRVWPGTDMALSVQQADLADGLSGGSTALEPQYFIEPSLGADIFDLIDRCIGDDERFFFFNPRDRGKNYNYDSNELLVEAIAAGERGAYWDILRRLAD
jgi:radical SAM superfamily enzyme YgiQ (UPF0313 family)